MTRALLVVDVQKDFVEGGSLAVPGGRDVARGILAMVRGGRNVYPFMLASKDWHTADNDNGRHFDDWPAHCIADTEGAEFAGGLDETLFNRVFYKGQGKPAYSAFEGTSTGNAGLGYYLTVNQISELVVCGIATDYCVKQTVLDALWNQYEVAVISKLTAAVGNQEEALAELEAAGAKIV